MRKSSSPTLLPIILVAPLWLSGGLAHAGLVFNFSPTGNANADAGFAAAGARWSSVLTDNVQINIAAGFEALGSGILAQASTRTLDLNYAMVRNALLQDATSSDDATATAHLPGCSVAGCFVDMLINRTANNPNGAGSAKPYVDHNRGANNATIRLASANAKALGWTLPGNVGVDAAISFSSSFSFDFDPADGVAAGTFDFIGIATHEIGHALGFFSGVDALDSYSQPANGGPGNDDDVRDLSTLDLYRYSDQSYLSGVIDWSADERDKYFSLDGGMSRIALFATGKTFGDGRQASHWKDNLGIGIMDPTTFSGEVLVISEVDLRALDVIGWNLTAASIPEPSTAVMLLTALLSGCMTRSVGRQRPRGPSPNGRACGASGCLPTRHAAILSRC